uniref:Uncharacterized protein n=1 Tax=Kalanchoe fedtschenkoi TaxID=63787 RepID=A0A7N0RC03_KALFE
MATSSSVSNRMLKEASHAYPPPLAKYEDVVANSKFFMTTLEKLHSTMGTKFMIPVIGGKELNLHRLFVEVTSRGGIDKIVREKKWKEVTAVFNFPSSATNASFVLRKYYISLLHHYEQIYFFKARNWVPSSDLVHTPHKTPTSARGGYGVSANPGSGAPHPSINMLGAQDHPAALIGASVTGIIDGKFDSGYLVTITIGSQKLKGVLYQAAEHHQVPLQYQPLMLLPDTTNVTATGSQRRRRRKKSEIKRRDPAHPKPNRSGYNFFFAEQHARLKTLHPGKDREISKMIGELWTNLNDTERCVYQEKAMKDKERYKIEMEGYREKIRTGQIVPNTTTQQRLAAGTDARMVDVKVGVFSQQENSSSESGEDDVSMDNDDSENEASQELGSASDAALK